MRADGRIDLDIRATIETNDGHRVALSADGVGVLHEGESISDLFKNVRLTAATGAYAWGERTPSLSCGDRELGHRQDPRQGFVR
jgi:hypothetical protein